MSTTITEAPYGAMSWALGGTAETDEQTRERMAHAAVVLNRAADVFYVEAGHDYPPHSQAHSTPVQLAAFALAMQMADAHPAYDSFSWAWDSSCSDEMEALQGAVTPVEWQQIDDLAREYRAQFLLARIVALAFANSDVPLADMVAAALPKPWDSITSGEVQELATLASRTALRNVKLEDAGGFGNG
jgi:hypothetical protein